MSGKARSVKPTSTHVQWVHGMIFVCVQSSKHKSDVTALLTITCTASYCCFVVLQPFIFHVVGKVPICIW